MKVYLVKVINPILIKPSYDILGTFKSKVEAKAGRKYLQSLGFTKVYIALKHDK